MSGDVLGKRIHKLRTERDSIKWSIDGYRAKGEIPPDDLLADLRKVGNDLLAALDEQAEGI